MATGRKKSAAAAGGWVRGYDLLVYLGINAGMTRHEAEVQARKEFPKEKTRRKRLS